MMKKIVALLFSLIFLFSACSGKTEFNESNVVSYVGAGEMTVINALVKSNGFFVEDVFIANHLPVDTEKVTEISGETYAPVISDEFADYPDFEERIRSVYSSSAAEGILSSDKYAELDGKLYFNMKYENAEKYTLDWSEVSASATINAEGKYEITAKVKGTAGLSKQITLYATNENGNIRLENIYY